jgi:heme-degrading monooxygenase HmoA
MSGRPTPARSVRPASTPPDTRRPPRRFADRVGLIESAEGFEGFTLLRPVDSFDRYVVITQWRSEEDFIGWTKNEAFQTPTPGSSRNWTPGPATWRT